MSVSSAPASSPSDSVGLAGTLWGRWLTIDLRSAALFRITLGLWLLLHGWQRAECWTEFYSAAGVVTAEMLPQAGDIPYCPSLLVELERSAWGATLFLCGMFLVYTLLLLGCWTRWMSLFALLVFSTVAHRNPYLVIGADEFVGSLLLWSMCLPLGTRFSIDAILKAKRGDPSILQTPSESNCVSVAALGVLLQISILYLATAWQKTGTTWWAEGTALARVLGMTTFRLPGAAALEWLDPEQLRFLTRGVLVLEYALPALILSPFARPICRRMACCGMLGLHLGIAQVLDVGLFSLAMLAATPLLLTTADWRLVQRLIGRTRLYAQAPPVDAPLIAPWRPRLNEALATLLLLGLIQLNWNRSFAPPELRVACAPLEWPWRFAAAPQRWDMFAPDPPKFDPQVSVLAAADDDDDGGARVLWECPAAVEHADARHGFLWKLLLMKAALLHGERTVEGSALRAQICRFFANDFARQQQPTELCRVEMRVSLVPTDAADKTEDAPQSVWVSSITPSTTQPVFAGKQQPPLRR